MYGKLLERQMKRYLKDGQVIPEEWKNLLNAVNLSYEHYERDHVLANQSLEISSRELRQLDIDHQKTSQRELNLQKQMVSVAKQAGMMQVATSVLHNVGNVLNSVNVSVNLLKESIISSELSDLPKIAQLLKEHQNDIYDYLCHDEKGKHILQYIISLSDSWVKEHKKNENEINVLIGKVEHIKNIIKMQQSLTSQSSFKEKVSINEMLNNLINIRKEEIANSKIEIQDDYGNLPEVLIEEHKLLQIFENLFSNALDALKLKNNEQKVLSIRTSLKDEHVAQVEISDNGCGIQSENLEKLFSFGFTTKKEGHGFGLHSCSLLAKELGGDLKAESQGIDKGATFTLTLAI